MRVGSIPPHAPKNEVEYLRLPLPSNCDKLIYAPSTSTLQQ